MLEKASSLPCKEGSSESSLVKKSGDHKRRTKKHGGSSESGMNKGENLWMVFFLCTMPIFVYMFYALTLFHSEMEKRDMPVYKFSDFKLSIMAACLFYFIKNIWERAMYPIVEPFINKKHVGLEREIRTKRVVKWIFDFFYYLGFTVFGYMYFFEYIPQIMGGNAQCINNFRGYPYFQDTKWLQEYYLLQLGNHTYRTVDQCLRKRNDIKFWEYFLHHFLALVLVVHSYASHWTRPGSLVLLSHDFTDIFLSSVRAQEALRYQIPYFFPIYFAFTVLTWAYMRGIVFPACIMSTAWELYFLDSYPPRARICDLFFAIMTVFLCVMNFYWIYALSKVGLKSLFSRSYANVYDPTITKKVKNEEETDDGEKEKKD